MPPRSNSTSTTDSTPGPYDLAVERALIGACLDSEVQTWPRVLQPELFCLDRHMILWRVMGELAEWAQEQGYRMVGVDELALELQRQGQYDYCGGPTYLAQCMDEGKWAVIGRHEQAIRARARKEYIRALATQLAMDPTDEDALERLLDNRGLGDGSATRITLLEAAREKPPDPIKTGIDPLDRMIGGLRPATIAVLGGRTSHGKSTLAANIAYRVACAGRPVEFLELEESAYRMSERMTRLIGGPVELQDSELLALNILVGRVKGDWSEPMVEAAIMTSEADLVILDHIQQIATPKAWNRTYGLEQLLARIHRAALRSNKAVLVCAQLNRQVEERRNEPTLGDLRDSGALEQIPRLVMLGYWPNKHDNKRDPSDYVLNVAKNSYGATGRLVLRWNAGHGEFL